MPVCENCQYEWTWKQSMRSMATLGHGYECQNCSAKQFPTKRARTRHFLVTMLIPLFLMFQAFTDFSPAIVMAATLVLGLILILIIPFYTEVQNEDEPLW